MRLCCFSSAVACLLFTASVAVSREKWDFHDAEAGALPKGWIADVTGSKAGDAPRWEVISDEGHKVLAQLESGGARGDFPVCLKQGSSLRDGSVSVRFKPISGRVDQAGGVVFRAKDKDNFYIARANALENNVSIYVTHNAKRKTIKYWDNVEVALGKWHDLKVEVNGFTFRVSLNGKLVGEVEDTEQILPDAGMVGFWTKADSVTYFDEVIVGGDDQHDDAAQTDHVGQWRRIDQSQYVGSAKCAECHEEHYDGWKETGHNKMERRPVAEGPGQTVFADFTQQSPYRNFEPEDVEWVIGHRWKQRFIGEIDGREVVFPAQWSIRDEKWQPYTGGSDWWYPHHPDWEQRSEFKLCVGCHSTGTDHYTQSYVERTIGCERCHGPGRAHAEEPLAENIVNPARLRRDRSMEICLSCHLPGRPPGDQTDYAWAVGYEPGMRLADFWEGFEPQQGKKTADFWPNGTARKNRVQGGTFLQSWMCRHAGMQCTDCHNPHGSRHRSMTIKSADDNALCMMCHAPGKQAGLEYRTISDHTHHPPTSPGSRCVECHMPKTGKNAVAGESRDHTFKFISPADTIKYGVPNSCNGCHADKTPEWALSELEKWSD